MKNLLLTAIAIFGFSAVSFGQVSADGTATANVLVPISILKGNDLIFGSFGQALGTVTIPTSGPRTSSGVTLYTVAGETPQAATFTVTGDGGHSISIVLPKDGDISINGPSSATLPLTLFNSDPAEGTTVLSGGTLLIKVGATLSVTATQTKGAYTGVFPVIVNYN